MNKKIPYFGVFINAVGYIRFLIFRLMNPFSSFEQGVKIKGEIKNIKIGRNVVVQSGTVLHGGGNKWCDYKGGISIGENSTISPNCVLYGAGLGGIEIGDDFDCGPFVGIYASRSDYESFGRHIFKPVKIGSRVIVFSHVVIGPGVTIGDRAVIAAGSVVLKDVPPDCMVGGIPAVILKNKLFFLEDAKNKDNE